MVTINQPKWTLKMVLEANKECKLTLTLDPALTPAQQMTSLLFAKDLFKSEVLYSELNFRFMFDESNPTVEDEIIT